MASHNRTHASDRGKVIPDLPQTPTIGTATAGIQSAAVTFTAPVLGGLPTSYTVLSSPGSITGTGTSSPITVSGLTAGTAYTFTVRSNNATGSSAYSSASNSATPLVATSFESIATVNPSSNVVTFNSIPQTYKHLQLSIMGVGSGGVSDIIMRYNSDSGANYQTFQTRSGRSTPQSYAYTGNTYALASTNLGQSSLAPNVAFVDILEYTNTSKFTVSRSQTGYDINTSGESVYTTGAWNNTAAVTRIDLSLAPSYTWNANSVVALYGIKG